MDLQLVNLDLVKFKDHPTIIKKKKKEYPWKNQHPKTQVSNLINSPRGSSLKSIHQKMLILLTALPRTVLPTPKL